MGQVGGVKGCRGREVGSGLGGVAAVGHVGRNVAIDGKADEVVEDVAEEEPGEDEDGEGDVAGGGVARVFEDFGAL